MKILNGNADRETFNYISRRTPEIIKECTHLIQLVYETFRDVIVIAPQTKTDWCLYRFSSGYDYDEIVVPKEVYSLLSSLQELINPWCILLDKDKSYYEDEIKTGTQAFIDLKLKYGNVLQNKPDDDLRALKEEIAVIALRKADLSKKHQRLLKLFQKKDTGFEPAEMNVLFEYLLEKVFCDQLDPKFSLSSLFYANPWLVTLNEIQKEGYSALKNQVKNLTSAEDKISCLENAQKMKLFKYPVVYKIDGLINNCRNTSIQLQSTNSE